MQQEDDTTYATVPGVGAADAGGLVLIRKGQSLGASEWGLWDAIGTDERSGSLPKPLTRSIPIRAKEFRRPTYRGRRKRHG